MLVSGVDRLSADWQAAPVPFDRAPSLSVIEENALRGLLIAAISIAKGA